MQIVVKCPVHPTEDMQSVEEAIENIFGAISLTTIRKEDSSELVSTDLNRENLLYLRQVIYDKRIIDAVRVRLLRNRDELTSVIYLDKQAAFVAKLRLIDNANEDPPLGSIELKIDFTTESEFEKFLNWFSPPTKDGRIIT